MSEDTRFGIFFGVWIILGIISFILFFRAGADVATKKRFFPRFVIGAGALFLFFIYFTTLQIWPVLLATPFVILISYLNVKFNTFCDKCGKPVMPFQNFQLRAKFCGRCGSELRWD